MTSSRGSHGVEPLPGPDPVLSVVDLTIRFPARYGSVAVLDGVGLEVGSGECVAVVGESGCGKSLLGLAAADLLPRTAEVGGTISFRGRDLRRLSSRGRRSVRGAGIAVIYQDALTSLNPGMSVGAQLRQVCRLGAAKTPEQLVESVGLPEVERIMRSKPYQLSGGQRQRVLTAMALAREPALIIADEPTTALDVTVQAQIVQLLQELQAEHQFALMFVSHDLALVSQLAQRVVVMYAGQVVEQGRTERILSGPRHPYTAGLLAASASLEEGHEQLAPIPGYVTPPQDFASGCRFRQRCSRADEACAIKPSLVGADGPRVETADGESTGGHVVHRVACFHPIPVDAGLFDSQPAVADEDVDP